MVPKLLAATNLLAINFLSCYTHIPDEFSQLYMSDPHTHVVAIYIPYDMQLICDGKVSRVDEVLLICGTSNLLAVY